MARAKLLTAGWSASSGLIISISIPSFWKSPRKDSPRRSTRIVRPGRSQRNQGNPQQIFKKFTRIMESRWLLMWNPKKIVHSFCCFVEFVVHPYAFFNTNFHVHPHLQSQCWQLLWLGAPNPFGQFPSTKHSHPGKRCVATCYHERPATVAVRMFSKSMGFQPSLVRRIRFEGIHWHMLTTIRCVFFIESQNRRGLRLTTKHALSKRTGFSSRSDLRKWSHKDEVIGVDHHLPIPSTIQKTDLNKCSSKTQDVQFQKIIFPSTPQKTN